MTQIRLKAGIQSVVVRSPAMPRDGGRGIVEVASVSTSIPAEIPQQLTLGSRFGSLLEARLHPHPSEDWFRWISVVVCVVNVRSEIVHRVYTEGLTAKHVLCFLWT